VIHGRTHAERAPFVSAPPRRIAAHAHNRSLERTDHRRIPPVGVAERFWPGSGDEEQSSLVTTLITDLVGSTEHLVRIGDDAWERLLEEHDRRILAALRAHHGRLIRHTGDGVLATFVDAASAVECACTIRDEMHELGLPLRAGLHLGWCRLLAHEARGLTIHVGARVAAAAQPDEILTSAAVRDLLVDSELAFADRGEHRLKGLPTPWRLFAVTRAE
jgi:class 3 adenylate cyclase